MGLLQRLDLGIQAGAEGVDGKAAEITGTAIGALGRWAPQVLKQPQDPTGLKLARLGLQVQWAIPGAAAAQLHRTTALGQHLSAEVKARVTQHAAELQLTALDPSQSWISHAGLALQEQRIEAKAAIAFEHAIERQGAITAQTQVQRSQSPLPSRPAIGTATGNNADGSIAFHRLQRLQTVVLQPSHHLRAG